MKRTLTPENAAFTDTKRGLLITEIGEHSTARYYIPRSNVVIVTQLGATSTNVKFGKGTLTLSMPNEMYEEHGGDMLRAALGEDAL